MAQKSKGKIMNKYLITALLILLVFTVLIFLPKEQGQIEIIRNGTAHALEFGNAEEYSYLTFYHNGSGKTELIALSEQPKTSIIVLKKDFLNTERYPFFIKLLQPLAKKGFSINEVDEIGEPQNSVIIIPAGAMPSYILEKFDALTKSNYIIYIGKTDLIFSENLVRTKWLHNVSNSSKLHLRIIEKTLEEFYAEKNLTIFAEIERNAWAAENQEIFEYSGEGRKTIFIKTGNANWLRMLPLADSLVLRSLPVKITGNEDIFPWQKIQLTIEMNYSSGTPILTVEKDGNILSTSALDRVREKQAFFFTQDFSSSGNYLIRVSDLTGTIGAKRIHVKDLNISLAKAYGNSYEFSVLVDGAPVESAETIIGLNHSNNTVRTEVKNGKLRVYANLKQGENAFVITMFGHTSFVFYNNNQESILTFYAKYLTPGIALVAILYVLMRMKRKPVYKIHVSESVQTKNPEIKLNSAQIITALKETEACFGWKNVPVYAKEIEIGLKKFTNGGEINEGNIEAIMKKLEEKGSVKSHLGLYWLSEWNSNKENALRRIVRDKLVQNGIEFSETSAGFRYKEKHIVFSPENAGEDCIIVFEDKDKMRDYLSSLDDKELAKLEIKKRNGVLELAILDELDELL